MTTAISTEMPTTASGPNPTSTATDALSTTESQALPMDPMAWLNKAGVRSWHLYLAGLASVGASFVSWLVSRGKRDSRPQSDRWGLFIGEWAPTFFAMGAGLKQEELERRSLS